MNTTDVPIFVNCRDRVTSLRLLVAWLERAGHEHIVLVDNASTYPALLEFYESTPHEVVRLDQNYGQTALWDAGLLDRLGVTGHFVLTDPDVVPSDECPLDAVAHFAEVLARHPDAVKVGFSLRIDDLPRSYRLRDAVIEWERAFWTHEVEPGVFEAPLDTTFALHVPRAGYRQDVGLRTAPPYTARHLPWYADSGAPTEEDRYYVEHARDGVLTWGSDAVDWTVVEGLDVRRDAGGRRPLGSSAFAIDDSPIPVRPVRVVSVLAEPGADAASANEGGTGVDVEVVPVDPDARNRAHGFALAAAQASGDVLCLLRRDECLLPAALPAAVAALGAAMWLRAPVEVTDGSGTARIEGDREWSLDMLLRQDPVERAWFCWRRDALGGSADFDESVPLWCEYDLEIRLAERYEPARLTAPAVRRRSAAANHWPPRRVAEDAQVARIRSRNNAARVLALEQDLAALRTKELEAAAAAAATAAAMAARADELDRALRDLYASTSWRITRPLRAFTDWRRGRRR
ncbi:MAG TPA: hypothetical protein VEP49_01055 [Acidimicrobiia bacterium]|nr:hypothetical protein [Acidimicrobiia bacterium]